MISDIDYMKFAMSQERDKTEIDPVLRSKAWSAVILGLAMFWSVIALVVCNVWFLSSSTFQSTWLCHFYDK